MQLSVCISRLHYMSVLLIVSAQWTEMETTQQSSICHQQGLVVMGSCKMWLMPLNQTPCEQYACPSLNLQHGSWTAVS